MQKNLAKARAMNRARSVALKHRVRLINARNRACKKSKAKRLSTTPGSLGDYEATIQATDALIDAVFHHRTRYRRLAKSGSADPRHFLFTACFDDGVIEADELSEDQLNRVISKTYRAMRALQLHGVLVLQIVGIQDTNTKLYHVWLHVHGIVWTYDPRFRADARARAISRRPAYSNYLNAQSINLRSRRQSARAFKGKGSKEFKAVFSRLRVDQVKASLAHLSYYLLRPSAYMQKVVPSKKDPSKSVMRSNSGDYPNWLALKIHHLENQIPIERAVFSVGDGKAIRSGWKRAFAHRRNRGV